MKTSVLDDYAVFFTEGFNENYLQLIEADISTLSSLVDWVKDISDYNDLAANKNLLILSQKTNIDTILLQKYLDVLLFLTSVYDQHDDVDLSDLLIDVSSSYSIDAPRAEFVEKVSEFISVVLPTYKELITNEFHPLNMTYAKSVTAQCVLVPEFKSFNLLKDDIDLYSPTFIKHEAATILTFGLMDGPIDKISISLSKDQIQRLTKLLRLTELRIKELSNLPTKE